MQSTVCIRSLIDQNYYGSRGRTISPGMVTLILHFRRNVMGRLRVCCLGILSYVSAIHPPGAGMGLPIAKVKFPLILPTAGSR